MTGNKINSKKKDEKGKYSKGAPRNIYDNEDIDFSLLRKPIVTSITGFAQARKIFDQATEELKGLLTSECDILYECKVCRNIFRSLANFISHKRVYCKETFNSSVHSHFIKESSTQEELLTIKRIEEGYKESLSENSIVNSEEDEKNEERIPITKDLTQVLEKVTNTKGVKETQIEDQQLAFQKIPKSSVAVFQNINISQDDNMKTQVNELHNILSQENAVLQSDGTFKVQPVESNTSAENVIQISDDDENDNNDTLKCKVCDLQFATLKTLRFHIKYKHVENRLVYPCPDCIDIFSTSWSVYRHLFKVHRKTAAQIRRMRESIQAKAFRMNNPPAFYEKRKNAPKVTPQKLSEEERLDQENQAWLDELDGEGEGRRCCGCGRTFERRAALVAHSNTCVKRQRRRIQIQIRKDYHKEQTNPYLSLTRPTPPADSKTASEESQPDATVEKKKKKETKEDKSVKEADIEIIDDNKNEKDDKPEDDQPKEDKPKDDQPKDDKPKDDQPKDDNEMEYEEAIPQPKPLFYDSALINKLPFARQAEKNNLNAFRQKILPYIDLFNVRCKKCEFKNDVVGEFLEHMAGHFKWVRYACKLCNFKHYNFDKLPEHVKIVHKLKGDTDFYFSTVKAIDGAEALELAEPDESSEVNEESPQSRRPSRCSSDSSRLSDDSSSSSSRLEGSRKRKANKYRNNAKKKKETFVTENGDVQKESDAQKDLRENDSSSNSKIFEENSSDFDELDERITKRQSTESSSVASRRPIRKKSKPKDENFEYDLSKFDQGYRDITVSKNAQTKKKTLQDILQNYETINKECCGALVTLSRRSVGKAQAHMKTLGIFNTSKETRISAIFARPMIPKVSKGDKISPKKDEKESKDVSSPVKIIEAPKPSTPIKNNVSSKTVNESEKEVDSAATLPFPNSETSDLAQKELKEKINKKTDSVSISKEENESKTDAEKKSSETAKPNINMPLVPIKFRRQSLDVIKNPIIKKNITDFTKAGMKTKILVIKPINRKSVGIPSLNTPVKYQTIKLKDPKTANAANNDKKDQVVVVQVPQVECSANISIISNNIVDNATLSATAEPSSVDVSQPSIADKDIRDKIESYTEKENNNEVPNDVINEVDIPCESEKGDTSKSVNEIS